MRITTGPMTMLLIVLPAMLPTAEVQGQGGAWNRVPPLPTGCYSDQDTHYKDSEVAREATRVAQAKATEKIPSESAIALITESVPRLAEYEARGEKVIADIKTDGQRLPAFTEDPTWPARFNAAYLAFCADWFKGGRRGNLEIFGFLTEYRKFLTALYSEMGTMEEAVSKYLAIAQKIFAQREAKPRIN